MRVYLVFFLNINVQVTHFCIQLMQQKGCKTKARIAHCKATMMMVSFYLKHYSATKSDYLIAFDLDHYSANKSDYLHWHLLFLKLQTRKTRGGNFKGMHGLQVVTQFHFLQCQSIVVKLAKKSLRRNFLTLPVLEMLAWQQSKKLCPSNVKRTAESPTRELMESQKYLFSSLTSNLEMKFW